MLTFNIFCGLSELTGLELRQLNMLKVIAVWAVNLNRRQSYTYTFIYDSRSPFFLKYCASAEIKNDAAATSSKISVSDIRTPPFLLLYKNV